jgi:uncharacterized protein YgfB (UPF0149 family)
MVKIGEKKPKRRKLKKKIVPVSTATTQSEMHGLLHGWLHCAGCTASYSTIVTAGSRG